jgi:hypothetical protein
VIIATVIRLPISLTRAFSDEPQSSLRSFYACLA